VSGLPAADAMVDRIAGDRATPDLGQPTLPPLDAPGIGVIGVLAGATATAMYASTKSWAVVIPAEAWRGIARGHPDRRVRRSDAGRSSLPNAAHHGNPNGLSEKWISDGSLV
jgi:hypothetical protein